MDASGKKRYNAPKLIVHGSLGQITESKVKVKAGAADEFTQQGEFDPISGTISGAREAI